MMNVLRERISDLLWNTTKGQAIADQLLADHARTVVATRAADAAQLATCEAELIAAMQRHASDRAPLLAEVGRLESLLQQPRARLEQADLSHKRAALDADATIERLRVALRRTASPRIAECVAELRELVQQTYRQQDSVTERCIDGKNRCVWSNQASIAPRIEAIFRVIALLGESGPVIFEPLAESELTARLDALRADIPDIEPRPRKYRGDAA